MQDLCAFYQKWKDEINTELIPMPQGCRISSWALIYTWLVTNTMRNLCKWTLYIWHIWYCNRLERTTLRINKHRYWGILLNIKNGFNRVMFMYISDTLRHVHNDMENWKWVYCDMLRFRLMEQFNTKKQSTNKLRASTKIKNLVSTLHMAPKTAPNVAKPVHQLSPDILNMHAGRGRDSARYASNSLCSFSPPPDYFVAFLWRKDSGKWSRICEPWL